MLDVAGASLASALTADPLLLLRQLLPRHQLQSLLSLLDRLKQNCVLGVLLLVELLDGLRVGHIVRAAAALASSRVN